MGVQNVPKHRRPGVGVAQTVTYSGVITYQCDTSWNPLCGRAVKCCDDCRRICCTVVAAFVRVSDASFYQYRLGHTDSCSFAWWMLPKLFPRYRSLACLPSACEWKTTTEAAADGWKGLLSSSSSLAGDKDGESEGSSLSVMLAGSAGSRATMGAMMQWDNRHSGFVLKHTNKWLEWRNTPNSTVLHLQIIRHEISQLHTFSKQLPLSHHGGFLRRKKTSAAGPFVKVVVKTGNTQHSLNSLLPFSFTLQL